MKGETLVSKNLRRQLHSEMALGISQVRSKPFGREFERISRSNTDVNGYVKGDGERVEPGAEIGRTGWDSYSHG